MWAKKRRLNVESAKKIRGIGAFMRGSVIDSVQTLEKSNEGEEALKGGP